MNAIPSSCPCGCGHVPPNRNGIQYISCLGAWREVPVELRSLYEKSRALPIRAHYRKKIIECIRQRAAAESGVAA